MKQMKRMMLTLTAVICVCATTSQTALAYRGHSYWAADNRSYYQRNYPEAYYNRYVAETYPEESETSTDAGDVGTQAAIWRYTPAYTFSAEPGNGSIDEYTISDYYVRARIRTRDRAFVSHIDELHFTDD